MPIAMIEKKKRKENGGEGVVVNKFSFIFSE